MDYLEMEALRHSDELYHHGIIGMKWGVRRYQNTDGTLTEAGKKRLNRIKSSETKARYFSNGSEVERGEPKKYPNKNAKAVYDKYQKDHPDYAKATQKIANGINKIGDYSAKNYEKLFPDGSHFHPEETDDKAWKVLDELTTEYHKAIADRDALLVGSNWMKQYYKDLTKAINKDDQENDAYKNLKKKI